MNKKMTLREMLYSAVFAAIIAVMSQISFPVLAVPITLQTFAVALCGYVIGTKSAILSIVVYIALGAVGVPVFTGFKGGFQCLLGPTGGFIFGFIALTALCGLGFKEVPLKVVFGVLGLIVCHIFGFVQYSLVSGTDVLTSFMLVSLPFLIKDVISVCAAYLLSLPIKRALRLNRIY